MSAPAKKPATAAAKKPVTKEKAKTLGYVNWHLLHPATGEKIDLRSFKGFVIRDNEYKSREEQALIDLAIAKGTDGKFVINAELTIILAQDKPAEIDVTKLF